MAVNICPESHFNTIWHKVMLIVRILCIHLISHKNGSALECYFLCGYVSGITDWSWYSPISAMERGAINSVSPLESDMLHFESHFALKHTKVFLFPLYFLLWIVSILLRDAFKGLLLAPLQNLVTLQKY